LGRCDGRRSLSCKLRHGYVESETVLNNPTDIDYSLEYPVWINTLEATIAGIGSISVLQDQIVEGNLVRFVVSLNFAYSSGSVLANFFINPNLTVFTATTTAAQDLAPEAAVPEPSTWLLTALGGSVLWAFRRRTTKPGILRP